MSDYNPTENYYVYTKQAVEEAERIAMNMHARFQPVVTTPHLLMGLLKIDGATKKLFEQTLYVTYFDVADIVHKTAQPMPGGYGFKYRFTEDALRVLHKARELAEVHHMRQGMVEPEHVLLALLNINDETFEDLLHRLCVDHDALMGSVMQMVERKTVLVRQ